MVSNSDYVFINMLGRSTLTWAPLCSLRWGNKCQLEALACAKHQIVWAIPSHCRLGGIIGVHYFHQMTWLVGFFIFSQLPNHPHDSLMGPLYQPIHLGVIGHGSQLLHAEEFAQLTNSDAYEVCAMIA